MATDVSAQGIREGGGGCVGDASTAPQGCSVGQGCAGPQSREQFCPMEQKPNPAFPRRSQLLTRKDRFLADKTQCVGTGTRGWG